MALCTDKQYHATEREALNHLRWARRQPGGHRLRSLNVYRCPECNGWHVGRSRRDAATARMERDARRATTPPSRKPLTFGQMRRKLARLENQWDRQHRYHAAQIAKVVEADRLLWETEEEIRQLQYDVMAELGIPARST
jgi:hypothetical protein